MKETCIPSNALIIEVDPALGFKKIPIFLSVQYIIYHLPTGQLPFSLFTNELTAQPHTVQREFNSEYNLHDLQISNLRAARGSIGYSRVVDIFSYLNLGPATQITNDLRIPEVTGVTRCTIHDGKT